MHQRAANSVAAEHCVVGDIGDKRVGDSEGGERRRSRLGQADQKAASPGDSLNCSIARLIAIPTHARPDSYPHMSEFNGHVHSRRLPLEEEMPLLPPLRVMSPARRPLRVMSPAPSTTVVVCGTFSKRSQRSSSNVQPTSSETTKNSWRLVS